MISEIILLYKLEQIDVVLSHFGKKALMKQDKLFIIALDYEIELALRQKGIPYHSIQDCLKSGIIKNLEGDTIRILQKLFKAPEMNFFQYNGIRLLEARGRDLMTCYVRMILYYLSVISSIFNEHPNINQIYIPQSSQFVPSTADPVASFMYRIPIDVVMLFGEAKNIPVSVLPFNKWQFSKGRMLSLRYRMTTFLFKQGLQLVNFIITISRPPQKLKIFVIDHWRNVKPFIEKMDNVELVMMVRKEIKNMGWEAWKKRVRFCHPKDFLTAAIRKIAHNKQMEFRSIWQKIGHNPKFSKIFYYQDISFWFIVKSYLDYLITEDAERVICEIESIKELLLHFSINRVLLRATAKDEFYLTAKIASQLKIPSIEVQHGMIVPEGVFLWTPIKVNYFAAYGKLTKEILVNNQNNPQRIIEIGSPRFDCYLTQKTDKQSIEVLRNRLSIDPSRPVILLIVPATINLIRGWTCTSFDVIEIFQRFRKLQHEIEGLQIVLQLRPTSIQERFYRKAAAEIFGENAIITQYENMKELFSLSDVVISPISTVILEAMVIGKPVILYTIRGDVSKDKVSQFQLFKRAGAIRIADTLDELFNQVCSLISDEKAKRNLVKNAKISLQKYYRFDGKSSLRIIELLNKDKI